MGYKWIAHQGCGPVMAITVLLWNIFQMQAVKCSCFNLQQALAATKDEFAKKIRAMIHDDQIHDAQYYNVTPSLDSVGTTHVSVLAQDGMAVSVTSTINHMWVKAAMLSQY